jgi:hypothetical protein
VPYRRVALHGGDGVSDEQATLLDRPRAKKPVPLTEGQLVERLKGRYQGESGNGPAGCVVAQVRNQAGFDASRTIDALGFHFWPSRGLLIDAYECKSSRSDWLREVENPEKADDFTRLVDRFYVIVGRADLAKIDEVPPDWGLLIPHGAGLKEVKPAVVLHQDSPAIVEWAERASDGRRRGGPRPLPPGFDRSFLVALVRQAYKLTGVEPVELRKARDDGYAAGLDAGERSATRELERLRKRDEEAACFERALGYPIKGYRSYLSREDIGPADIGRTLRALLDGDAEVTGLRNRLSAAAENAERLAQEARSRLEALDAALVPGSVSDERP